MLKLIFDFDFDCEELHRHVKRAQVCRRLVPESSYDALGKKFYRNETSEERNQCLSLSAAFNKKRSDCFTKEKCS